jgi:hypothetical protein
MRLDHGSWRANGGNTQAAVAATLLLLMGAMLTSVGPLARSRQIARCVYPPRHLARCRHQLTSWCVVQHCARLELGMMP